MSENTQRPDPATVREAARVMYETTPMTFEEVGEEFDVADRTVKRWAEADGGWRKLNGPEITAKAQAVADTITSAVADVDGWDKRQTVVAEMRVDAAVDHRAAILARHRQEWAAPRALAYESMKKRDLELAKLAKTSADTLRLVQDAERKAWGIDMARENANVTVVIERV